MTLGDGIFWSTVLVFSSLAMFLISKRSKWQLVGKIFGGLLLASAVVAGGVWGWIKFQERPQVLTGISGIELGMSQVEITLKKGKPNGSLKDSRWDNDRKTYVLTMKYGDSEYPSNDHIIVLLAGDSLSQDAFIAWRVCYMNGVDEISGIGIGSNENDLTNKFGEADEISINENGLSKSLFFNRWNLMAVVEAESVKGLCATE